jgi:hypothetical protein
MKKRLAVLGAVLAVAGVAFLVAGGIAYLRVQDGYDSLQAFSAAQNVTLSYDDNGDLVDRGSVEEAEAIMRLLEEDWGYPVVASDLDPDDPLVDTATEYMYQMAVINHHVLAGTYEVTLDEAVEYNGETFEAGTYEVAADGRYWTDFDRQHPLEGPARELAWTGTVHGLVGELGVGTVTASTLQMGLALAGLFAGIGVVLMITGGGLVWVGRADRTAVLLDAAPLTVPAEFVEEHQATITT